MTNDPYQILGVSRSASQDEIKKAFHKLAHLHHPDKGGNEEVFKKISNAYAQLKDWPAQSQPAKNPFTVYDVDIHWNGSDDFSQEFKDMVQKYMQENMKNQFDQFNQYRWDGNWN